MIISEDESLLLLGSITQAKGGEANAGLENLVEVLEERSGLFTSSAGHQEKPSSEKH